MEILYQLGQCQVYIVKCLWFVVEWLQIVYQYNLLVEVQEVFFVEFFYYFFVIVFVVFVQYVGVVVFIGLCQFGFVDGVDVGLWEKLQCWCVCYFFGQDKVFGLDKVQFFMFIGVEIVCSGGSDICQLSFVGRGQWIQFGVQLLLVG